MAHSDLMEIESGAGKKAKALTWNQGRDSSVQITFGAI
jgi:hypothetical protein